MHFQQLSAVSASDSPRIYWQKLVKLGVRPENKVRRRRYGINWLPKVHSRQDS